jgi:hypothetical protein
VRSRVERARQRARDLYATQFDALGPAYRNTAELIRNGFENFWIRPAIDALQGAVLLSGDADEDEQPEEAGRT